MTEAEKLREEVYGYMSLMHYRGAQLTNEEFRDACSALEKLADMADERR